MAEQTLFERIFRPECDERVAVVFEQRCITYGELRSLTIKTAEKLNALNVKPGDRVAILLNDSPEFIASFIAIISLGAIAVPINMALRKTEQLIILKDCGARVAIIELQAASDLSAELPESGQLKHMLVVDRGADWMLAAPSGIELQPFDWAEELAISHEFPARDSADSDAFILYTSGSTGEPKGAVHSQSDIFYTNETYCREVLRLREGDRLFSSSRLPFAYGLGNTFTFPLLNGFTTILCSEKPVPEIVSRILRNYRPTIFFGVPVVYRMLLEHHRQVEALDTSSLRLCVSAGEALPAQLGEEWQKTFGVEVLDGIGSTEMLHMFMSNHQGDVRYGSTTQSWWITKARQSCRVRKAIFGFAARALPADTGSGPKHPGKLSSMAGCALAICIARIPMPSGGTWAAATTVSNRQANGFRRSKSKACF